MLRKGKLGRKIWLVSREDPSTTLGMTDETMKHLNANRGWLFGLAAAVALAWLVDNFGLNGGVIGVGLAAATWLSLAILKNPQLGLWCILFFLPFERIPSLDIGGLTLRINFFFGAVTLVAGLLAWAHGRLGPVKNPAIWPLLGYFLAALLSLTGAVETERSLVVLGFTLFTASFLWLVVTLLRTKEDLAKSLRILFAVSLIVGLFGIYQFLGDAIGLPAELTGLKEGYGLSTLGFPRIQAFSVEPLYLGNFLLLPLSLLLSVLMLQVKGVGRRGWLWLLFALLCLVLILTVSRGAYVAGAVSLLFLIITFPRQMARPAHLLIGGGLIAIVLAGTGWFITQGRDDALQQFIEHVTIGDLQEGESTQGRLSAFDVALAAWQDHRLLGIGLGNFGAYVKNYPDPREVEGYDIVNNESLEVLAETGLFGFAALAVLLAIVLSRSVIAYRAADDPLIRAGLAGSTAALLGLLVQYNFFSTLFIVYVWVLVGLVIATQNLALVSEKSNDSIPNMLLSS